MYTKSMQKCYMSKSVLIFIFPNFSWYLEKFIDQGLKTFQKGHMDHVFKGNKLGFQKPGKLWYLESGTLVSLIYNAMIFVHNLHNHPLYLKSSLDDLSY